MAAGHIEGAAGGIVGEEGLVVGMEVAEEVGIELPAGTAAVAGIDLAVLLDNTRPPRLHAVVDCTPLFIGRPERVASSDNPKYICCSQSFLQKRM